MQEHLNILIVIWKQFSLRMRVMRLFLISLLILAISSVSSHAKESDVSGKVSSSRLTRRAGVQQSTNNRGRNSKRGSKRKRNKSKRNRNGKKQRKNDKKLRKRKRKNRRVKQKAWRGGRTKKVGSRKVGRKVSDFCFRQSITIMKIWKDLVGNFIKQKKRMARQNGTMLSKSEKKGAFTLLAMALLKLGGGNRSNLVCAGSRSSP